MVILIALLLSFKLLFAVLCDLPKPIGPAVLFTSCLKTIPKVAATYTELENYVDTIIEYLKNSPYPLLFMGGPNGLTAFDTLAELEALKTQAADWAESVLDFYERIHTIVGKLKDPHATIQFPFLMSFAYFLPYGFAPVPEKENSFRLTENQLTSAYLSLLGGTNYTNYIVDKMDLKDGGSMLKPAVEAFSELALDVGSAGHDPHALFNSVIKSGNLFGAYELFRPEERYNPNVFFEGKNAAGADVAGLSIPWLGYFGGFNDNNIAEFDDLNPIVGNSESPPTFKRSRNSEKFVDRDKDSIKHFLPRLLHKQIPPIFVEREKMIKKIQQQFGTDFNLSSHSKRHESRMISSMYQKILAARTTSPSPVSLPTINLQLIDEYTEAGIDGECTIYADATNKLGYIRYTTFMQGNGDEDAVAAFFNNFGQKYKEMVNKGVTDVIFDVRGNGGGLVGIVEEFTDFFFHNTIFPAELDTDILLGTWDDNANELPSAGANFLLSLLSPPKFYAIVNGAKQPLDDIIDPPVTKTHTNVVGGSSGTFAANYTQRGFYDLRFNTSISSAFGGYSPFDAQHFYIITDGVCASCCGIFTKLAVEMKAARVLGYGVNPTKKDDLSTYVPGNCAGTLFSTSEVEQIRIAVQDISQEVIPPKEVLLGLLPPKFERENVGFGVTDYEFFSRNPLHSSESLYMVPARVAEVLPFQVSSEAEAVSDLQEIAAVVKSLYIDTPTHCLGGEVSVDGACKHCPAGQILVNAECKACATGEVVVAGVCKKPNAGAVVSVPTLLMALVVAVLMFL